ncbi:MAG TPA: hypothetical protein VFC42_06935 [Methylomirabilota bacterium]|nr:hypothetical protein [Methylomirabilota bacterium]
MTAGRRPPPVRRLGAAAAAIALAALAATAGAQAGGGAALRAEAAQLLRELAALRGTPSGGGPPPIVIRTREQRRRYVAAEFARKYSPARLEAERRAMVAWGLLPPEFDLAGFLVDLLAEQAAAYYDPVAKQMILANWLTPGLQSDALAHELVHALQDRTVGLEGFLAVVPGRSDAGLARQALVEGEAVALVLERTLRRQGRALAAQADVEDLRRAIETSATGPVLARAPRFVRALLTFPYARGAGFVHALVRDRSWPALPAVYRDPPRSTAAILHPARYLAHRDAPETLAVPDLGALLPAGSRALLEDDLGEFGLGEVLSRGADPAGAAATAAAWRGDRYALWDVPGSGAALVAVSAWADEAAATAFLRAYARILPAKHGLGPAASDDDRAAWAAEGRGFALDRLGSRVLILEGLPLAALEAVRTAARRGAVLY